MDCLMKWGEVANHSLLSKTEAGLCLDRGVGASATHMARMPVFTCVNTRAHACVCDSGLCERNVNV